MNETTPAPSTAAANPWLALALLLIGSTGFAAAWVLLAWMRDRQCSWMAVLAAVDAALLLRLAHARPGRVRAAAAVLATAASIVLANWGIVAAQVGRPMGLLPWESMAKLGPALAWTLATLANHPADLAWLWIALVVAFLAGR
ncbi:MAG TPA: hypothetical protein VLM17_02445 [Xanthomonadaceae bacterium]|nr:hypothetical protein [Xanthomonadaceae bacterium]